MIYGLGTALGWGLADFIAAIVSRRVGVVAALLLAQFAGLICLGIFFVVTHPSLEITAAQLALLVANGLIASVAYYSLYKGLELGPIALVSPIVSAYAAITIVLAVVLLNESIGGAVFVGMLVTFGGVALASTDLKALRRGGAMHGPGVRFGLVSMLAFGASTFLIARLARDLGWWMPVTVSRLTTTTALLVGSMGLHREPSFAKVDARSLLECAVIGVADVGGLILYARGSQLGMVSIVAAASAAYAVIPVIGGLLVFHERPVLNQIIGIVVVFAGLLLLGLAS
ncbi:MAG: EamA family transporter [Actinomycetota bacterium]